MKVFVIFKLFLLTVITTSNGQSVVNKYMDFAYGEKVTATKDYKTEVVFGDIKVSKKKPLIIKTPNKTEIYKIYTFNKILNKRNYKAFITGGTDPFRPTLVTTDNSETQIDELQLFDSEPELEKNQELIEEVVIKDETDILLKSSFYTWTVDKDGNKINRTGEQKEVIKRYKITDNGTIEEIKN